jgi:hypothetical protein
VQLTGFLDGTNKAPAAKLKINASNEEDDEEVPHPIYNQW